MIKRDQYNIIIQHNPKNPDDNDGGDSAFTTGIMAGCGSLEDLHLMPLFIKEGRLVRHPYQTTNTGMAPHNDPRSVSRDQVLCFFFGRSPHAQVKAAALNYAKGWRVNGDVLEPRHKLYLYKCADEKPPLWLSIVGQFNQALSLIWDCYIKPDHEMNQSICTNIVYGTPWIAFLRRNHPNINKNIEEYYNGWRDKHQIGLKLLIKAFIS